MLRMLTLLDVFRDTMLQCLRNCLQKSNGKPKLATIRTVIDYLTPLRCLADGAGAGKIDSTVSLADVRRAANACVGASIASASAIADVTASDVVGLMPWCQSSTTILGNSLVVAFSEKLAPSESQFLAFFPQERIICRLSLVF